MTEIHEGRLTFTFPKGWQATKFDEWQFYRTQFQSVCGGTKAIDILAISPDNCMWAIEIKDYRGNPLPKPSDLPRTVACKVRDSLAVLAAARLNANDATEQSLATKALACNRIYVVLHLEQDNLRSIQQATNPAVVLGKLKPLIKAIDPHPRVVVRDHASSVAWTVTYRR